MKPGCTIYWIFTSILIFCYKHTNTRRILALPLSIILKQNNNNGYSVILFAIIIIITIAIHTSIKICIPHFMCDSREINMIFTVECISCGWWGLLQICDKSNIAREREIPSFSPCFQISTNMLSWLCRKLDIFCCCLRCYKQPKPTTKKTSFNLSFYATFFIPCFLVPIKKAP